MGVLRLGEIGIEFRQSHVGDRLPVARLGFDVTIELAVEGMILYALKQLDGVVKSLPVSCGADIFRQAVEGEADGVELLACVQRLPLVVDAPIDSTILLVDKVLDKVLFRIGGSLQILILSRHAISSRERPEDAGIEDGPLLSLRMKHFLSVDTSIESTVLAVDHLRLPEMQDVVLQHILHLFS